MLAAIAPSVKGKPPSETEQRAGDDGHGHDASRDAEPVGHVLADEQLEQLR